MIVIDFETTGLEGIEAGDRIVEIGVADVDFERKTVTGMFGAPMDIDLTEAEADSWIFSEGYMSPAECDHSPIDESKGASILAAIIDGEYVTSFNTEFDIDKFLIPWFDRIIPDALDICFFRSPCIMKASAQITPNHVWPTLNTAYATLCGGYRKLREHRAMDDAVKAGRVMLELYNRGLYDPDREDEY